MKVVLTFLLVLGLVAVVQERGVPYVWTDEAVGNHDWDDEDNWKGSGFPSASGHYAEIPAGATTWEINQMEYTIGQMTILDDVDFAGTETLTTGALIIDARGGEEIPDPVVVEIVTEGGKIIANP
jgi:hypothetical protein